MCTKLRKVYKLNISFLSLTTKVLELILLLINHLLHVGGHDTQTYLLWVHLYKLLIEEFAILDFWHVKWLQFFFHKFVNIEAIEKLMGQNFLETILA